MKRVLTLFAAAFALVACTTASTPTAPPPAESASSALQVAPLNYHMRTLPNGLRVYAIHHVVQ